MTLTSRWVTLRAWFVSQVPPPPAPEKPTAATVRIRIHFTVTRPQLGAVFDGEFMHTTGMERGASAWFPCVDVPESVHTYYLHVTVPVKAVAVASGSLVAPPELSACGKKKAYQYKMQVRGGGPTAGERGSIG